MATAIVGRNCLSLSARKLCAMSAVLQRCVRHRHNIQSHEEGHEFKAENSFLGSWKVHKDPKKAEAALALLRRDYAKNVRDLRKQYIYEMEAQRQEREWKEEARLESVRLAKEERRAAKAKLAEDRAAERRLLDQEFRKTLAKERAEKLELWRRREQQRKDKMQEKEELLRRQSPQWVEQSELDQKITNAYTDIIPS